MGSSEVASDDVAAMLRESLRGFLDVHWRAVGLKDAASPEAVSAIWRKLVGQGIAALGSNPDEGGLREIMVVMAELGRAACPVLMWSAALANLALSPAGTAGVSSSTGAP